MILKISASDRAALKRAMERAITPHRWIASDLSTVDERAVRSFVEQLNGSGAKRSIKVRRKTAAQRAETSELREQLEARSDGCCESCGFSLKSAAPHMDHFWGRAKQAQTVTNCWLICYICHRRKTDNAPSAEHWLNRFIAHCLKHGFEEEVKLARSRLQYVLAKKARGA